LARSLSLRFETASTPGDLNDLPTCVRTRDDHD
jgi:hypothetical protein